MKNHLKRILIAAAIIALTPAMVHAQDWDRVKETKDAFSGEKAKQATLGIGYQWAIILKQVGDKYSIGIAINSSGDIAATDVKKLSIMGALNLYLDLINIFLYLLRLFGSRR